MTWLGGRSGRSWVPELATAIGLAIAPGVLPLLGANPDMMGRILIWGLFGLGFDILFGYTGLLSFGQAAFYGTGGFVTAYLLTAPLTGSVLLALLIAMLLAAAIGVVIGYLTLRRTGIYFAMITLAFGEMFFFLENSPLKAYTGGENGIPGVPSPNIPLGFTTIQIHSGWSMYYFLAVIFFVGFLIARRIVLSPFGSVLTAIRGNAQRALAVGHAVNRYKLAAFVIAAAYGGLAGGLLGVFQNYMPPEAFVLDTSGQLVIQTVIGGAGTLFGPLLGAAIWLYLRDVLQHSVGLGAYWKLILGAIFVLLVTAFRRGICGEIIARLRHRAERKDGASEAAASEPRKRVAISAPLPVHFARMTGEAPILQARGLSKRYGGLAAVSEVSLTVVQGELRGLIGPNGAGKSTLFKMLTGEVPPTAGDIYLRGEKITGRNVTAVCQRGMSKSYQINQLFEALTVRENLTIPVLARNRGQFRLDMLRGLHHAKDVQRQVDAMLELVWLDGRAGTPVHGLAYGEKRRLEIGLALATSADVLLLDEPLAGMSPEERGDMVSLIKQIHKGRTLIVVEHDMDAIFELAQQISVLYEGRLLAEGTPDEIQRSRAVQDAYLGGVAEGSVAASQSAAGTAT